MEEAIQKGLEEHNRLRALHQDTPPLELRAKLNVDAQAWADKLTNDWSGVGSPCDAMIHDKNRGAQGENIAVNSAEDRIAACVQATKEWWDEIKDYHYDDLDSNIFKQIGHFTQVVWSDTSKLGLGVSQMKNGDWLVVGRYLTSGNYSGKYNEKVKRLKE